MSKKGLGKGLKALIPSKSEDITEEKGILEIKVKDIVRNIKQPRQEFDKEKLMELADSIREHGVIQPVILRPLNKGKFELIAGERRWRAAKIAGVDVIPAIIRDVTERETNEIALIENIQRENLNPLEEAMAYRQLMEDFGLTQEEVSKKVGKSRSFVANTMRLLNLPEEAKAMVQKGQLSAGHARALLTLDNPADQSALAKKIAEKNISVRKIEKMVKQIVSGVGNPKREKKVFNHTSPIINDLEEQIQGKLGTKVRIKHSKKKGVIEIEYYGDEDLHRIIEKVLGEDYVL